MNEPAYLYCAKLKKIIDGDTVDLIVDLGFRTSTHQRFRLKGINTPSIFGVSKDSSEYKQGKKAREYVVQRFEKNGGECLVKSHRTEKYGRWLGEIWFKDSEKSLNEELLDQGLAEVM
ncbi:MAG: thermonuclease family protein [bacterium]|nr:thermonuclease family protein [bacterium]